MKKDKSITLEEKPEVCPKCGAPVCPILYGEPSMSEEDYFKTYGERVIYGGCCISNCSPKWVCSQCGQKIRQSKL